MLQLSQLLIVLFTYFATSSCKSVHSLKRNDSDKENKEKIFNSWETFLDYPRREVRPIEPGYIRHGYYQADSLRKNPKTPHSKRAKRCFCGPYGSVCPEGFSETEMSWPCPSESFVPPHYPLNGPPYEVGDDWSWLEDNYEGDVDKNVYGWNWKAKKNGNGPAGYTYDGYPCGHTGWCCCDDAKPQQNDKPSGSQKPQKPRAHHKQHSGDRVTINII